MGTMTDAPEKEPDGRSRRTSTRAGVVLQLEYRNAGHLLVSYCTNLSRGGLFIPTAEPLDAGSTLTLRLDVPGKDEPVDIDAEVRWTRAFDTSEGPAGMGLAFAGIDSLLGDQIDGIVARFSPLQVELVGNRPQAWSHVAAQVRSLVTCDTHTRKVDPDDVEGLVGADLVIVDLDSAPTQGLTVLAALSMRDRPPPRVALCTAQDLSMAGRASRHARVVRTPVDGHELRAAVLECVSQVYAHREDSGEPDSSTHADDDADDDSEDAAAGEIDVDIDVEGEEDDDAESAESAESAEKPDEKPDAT